jgi:hypothetical protein
MDRTDEVLLLTVMVMFGVALFFIWFVVAPLLYAL